MRKLVVSGIVLALLLVSSGLLLGYAGAAERSRPIRIGVLTASWGPTPHVVGLRDGLLLVGGGPRFNSEQAQELGYDRIFGRGTRPSDVASYLAWAVSR